MIRPVAALTALSATLLASCSMVPHYDRPQVTIPAEFKEAPGWRVAVPNDAVARGAWWQLFPDPVLDDLERAEKHGDLGEGSAFSTIAAKLRSAVERLGLTPYGEKGEPFDPQIHEAIFQQPTPGVTEDTVAEVVETGYRLGSTTVRVAKVVVAVPA